MQGNLFFAFNTIYIRFLVVLLANFLNPTKANKTVFDSFLLAFV